MSLLLPILAGVVAALLVNYVADTLPHTRQVSKPVCPQCGTAYPVGVYLSVQACPTCGRARGWRPWLVLAAMLALAVYTFLQPNRMGFALGMLVLAYFAIVVVIDVEHRLIMHPTSLVGGVLALGIGIWLRGLVPTLLGGLAGFGIMLVLYFLGAMFAKLRARRMHAAGQPADGEEALGGGDVILAAILGLLMGWPLIWFGLLLGVLLGGVIGLVLLAVSVLRGRYGKQALMLFMPYGPSFILSAFLILFLPNVVKTFLPN